MSYLAGVPRWAYSAAILSAMVVVIASSTPAHAPAPGLQQPWKQGWELPWTRASLRLLVAGLVLTVIGVLEPAGGVLASATIHQPRALEQCYR